MRNRVMFLSRLLSINEKDKGSSPAGLHDRHWKYGSLFACIGSSELLLTSLAQLFYGFIYKESVSYLPGLVFLITAGILVIEFCLSLVLYSIMSSEPVSVTETVIKVS
ncbi:Hypothetical predicted protein [Mytilus galloprovincialis]|uniref:Uncharacterized protein n=1 Tax=Mytilus galloprovincialis TaxID=29158 RepID=A0A8B6DYF5_MYTGA|nr:Hypothetical predicted protein [Mytilus galloprovincialis]